PGGRSPPARSAHTGRRARGPAPGSPPRRPCRWRAASRRRRAATAPRRRPGRRTGPPGRTTPPAWRPAAGSAPARPGVGAGPPRSRLRALEVRDELFRIGAGDHGDQLPAVLTPVVQDLLGRVDQQRHGGVLPLLHGSTLPAARAGGRLRP